MRPLDSEFSKVELVSCNAEVFDDVGNYAPGDIPGVPRERDDSVWAKRIGIMPMTSCVAQMNAPDFFQSALKSPAVERGVFAHSSSGENKFVSKSRGDRPASFKQSLEVGFGSLLKTQYCFTPVTAMGVAAREQVGFCNPNPVFVLPDLNSRDRNYHNLGTVRYYNRVSQQP